MKDSESRVELRFSLDPASRLKSSPPAARYLAYHHVVSTGGDCYRVEIAAVKGTLTIPLPIVEREGEERIPAGRAPVTWLLETQFESRCE